MSKFIRSMLVAAAVLSGPSAVLTGGRGRDGDYSPPPAQIPAGAANAPGSYLGW